MALPQNQTGHLPAAAHPNTRASCLFQVCPLMNLSRATDPHFHNVIYGTFIVTIGTSKALTGTFWYIWRVSFGTGIGRPMGQPITLHPIGPATGSERVLRGDS